MAQDVLDVVDMEGRREPGAPPPRRQGGFDLVWDAGGAVSPCDAEATAVGCLLGCFNPADKTQLRAAGGFDDEEEGAAAAAGQKGGAWRPPRGGGGGARGAVAGESAAAVVKAGGSGASSLRRPGSAV